jgi:hypothetical protein
MDQPVVALDMINRFINEESFQDFLLPVEGLLSVSLSSVSLTLSLSVSLSLFLSLTHSLLRSADALAEEYQNAEIPSAYQTPVSSVAEAPVQSHGTSLWLAGGLVLVTLFVYLSLSYREKR